LRVLDLFSGIGGFSLGLERAGMRTVAFCEIEEYPRQVLAKHWPGLPCYDDVRSLTADTIRRDGIAVDVICGGFPCQDVSFAGKRAGLEGARSGLWSDYRRIISELRPRFVIVENVPGLLNLGMGRVLGDLAALGYDAVWDCIPASAVGAPHRRDRVWIVAHADPLRQPGQLWSTEEEQASPACGCREDVADADQLPRNEGSAYNAAPEPRGRHADRGGPAVGADWWVIEPDVGRVAHGVPARVDRLRALGNAVVPQIPEIIGRAIMDGTRSGKPASV